MLSVGIPISPTPEWGGSQPGTEWPDYERDSVRTECLLHLAWNDL